MESNARQLRSDLGQGVVEYILLIVVVAALIVMFRDKIINRMEDDGRRPARNLYAMSSDLYPSTTTARLQ